jgi:serine/threonine kinase 32
MQLLERDPKRRLGCRGSGGIEAFKQHPWFRGMDWARLADKEVDPPFVPDSKKANFDATHELEELLLEDNPLKARKRNPNLDLSQMSADMRMMEESFTIYDHTKMARKSHFKDKLAEKELGTSTTTSAIGLDDQPLGETRTIYAHSQNDGDPIDSPGKPK